MPVPVSPCKDKSSQSATAGTIGAMTITAQETAHIPTTATNTDNAVDPDVVAGYRDCLKETLRFLIEEEKLSTDHPVVMGIAAHLTREHAHAELSKLSEELTTTLSPQSNSHTTTEVQSHLHDHVSSVTHRPVTAGYEITFVEDNENEQANESEGDASYLEDCSSDIECDEYSDSEEAEVTQAIMNDPELRRQLLRFAYQGCDLIASPQPISELHSGLIVQL